MTTVSEFKLRLKLLIDTKTERIIYAEAGKDFVDFLFRILVWPVGNVIRLVKEKGVCGCLSNLYESVENLNETYMQSIENKDILLNPTSFIYKQKAVYKCGNPRCSYAGVYYTNDPRAVCPAKCGYNMSTSLIYVAPPPAGAILKDAVTYMVMDDLEVKPMSTISVISILNKFNVKDVALLHEEVVTFGNEEFLKLLKASLESKTVLTSVFMNSVKVVKQ